MIYLLYVRAILHRIKHLGHHQVLSVHELAVYGFFAYRWIDK
jgi:hypothetical protein